MILRTDLLRVKTEAQGRHKPSTNQRTRRVSKHTAVIPSTQKREVRNLFIHQEREPADKTIHTGLPISDGKSDEATCVHVDADLIINRLKPNDKDILIAHENY